MNHALATVVATALLTTAAPTHSAVLHVPGDYPTIGAAIARALPGDTVEIASGIYHEHSINDLQSGVTIRSASGDPHDVVIDADYLGRIFYMDHVGPTARLEGITFRHGDGRDAANRGGAIYLYASSPSISRCVFRDNIAGDSGGAINCYASSAHVSDCWFEGNTTGLRGGAMYFMVSDAMLVERCTFLANGSDIYGGAVAFWGSNTQLVNCTFSGNRADVDRGSAVYSTNLSHPIFDNCLIAFNHTGGAVHVDHVSASPTFSCTDIFGNDGGDWSGLIADQADLRENFTADPLFCDPANGDLTIPPDSPCAPPGVTGCGLVGALPATCGTVAVRPLTWSATKARYR